MLTVRLATETWMRCLLVFTDMNAVYRETPSGHAFRAEVYSPLPRLTQSLLVHGQVTIIFVVSVCLFVCAEFFQPSSIRFGSSEVK